MRIYLSAHTAARSGGGLNGTLRNFDRFIQSELMGAGFRSSFEELYLTLSYPPMYMLPGVVGMEVAFRKYYDSYPSARLNRRYRKIDIMLKAPEFSEHFDKADQSKYQHQFEIESQYQHIGEADLARILIDKYLEAGELIRSKLKKEDLFEQEIFNSTLIRIKQSISPDFLVSVCSQQAVQAEHDRLKRALDLREKRSQSDLPKDKLIRDLRVFYVGLPTKALYPYDYQYVEILLNLLTKKSFKCPQYDHLYIQVAATTDEVLKHSINIEDWYVYGIATIDYDHYLQQNESEKQKIVFDVLTQGLRDIADIDKLDSQLLEETISEIRAKGLATELVNKSIENNNYKLTISYFSRSREEESPVFFTLTEKATNKAGRKQIGTAENAQISLWLQKVSLTNTHVKVKSSDSASAAAWLDDKPKAMEFSIAELLQ